MVWLGFLLFAATYKQILLQIQCKIALLPFFCFDFTNLYLFFCVLFFCALFIWLCSLFMYCIILHYTIIQLYSTHSLVMLSTYKLTASTYKFFYQLRCSVRHHIVSTEHHTPIWRNLTSLLCVPSRTCIFGQVNPLLMLRFDYLCHVLTNSECSKISQLRVFHQ